MIKRTDNYSELVSIHNVQFLLNLMRRLRKSIIEGSSSEFVRKFILGQYSKHKEVPSWVKVALELAEINSELALPY